MTRSVYRAATLTYFSAHLRLLSADSGPRSFTTLAGDPSTRELGGNDGALVISAGRAHYGSLADDRAVRMMDPMPIRQLSSTVQACRITPWPTVTYLPT